MYYICIYATFEDNGSSVSQQLLLRISPNIIPNLNFKNSRLYEEKILDYCVTWPQDLRSMLVIRIKKAMALKEVQKGLNKIAGLLNGILIQHQRAKHDFFTTSLKWLS